MLAGIWGLLSSLPQLISMVTNFVAWFNKITGNDPAGFINKVNDSFASLHKAQTEQEMIDAAKKIQDLIRSTR